MSVNSPTVFPRYAVSDWHTANHVLRKNAERLRDESHDLRQDARKLRNQTDNHTRWTQHESNSKLEKRIDDVNEWKKALEKCLKDTDDEINALQNAKNNVEVALKAKDMPLDVAIECLMLRENRLGIDLVRDKVEEQLHKEVEVIEGVKALLRQKVSESFEQLCLLQEARHQINCDLNDKCHALEIDQTCHQLNNNSDDINFQINPTRTIKGSITPEKWHEFSNYNKLRGEAEMKASQHLRESIFATLEKTKNDMEAQKRSTEYEFRKRIHETEQTRDELKWQQENTKDEISTLQQDIECLKDSIQEKVAPMKVAQTRLENRTNRRNAELCRDIPQYQLCQEVAELDGTIKALFEKLRVAEIALKKLLLDLERIEKDLDIKTISLDLDDGCMKTREKLVSGVNINDKETSGTRDINEKMRDISLTGEPESFRKTNSNKQQQKEIRFAENSNDFRPVETNRGLKSTYNIDFETIQSKRSGDLQRTLGRSTEKAINESHRKEILLN